MRSYYCLFQKIPDPKPAIFNNSGLLLKISINNDGVFTDNGVYYSERGEEMKRYSIRDGMGVEAVGSSVFNGEEVVVKATEHKMHRKVSTVSMGSNPSLVEINKRC